MKTQVSLVAEKYKHDSQLTCIPVWVSPATRIYRIDSSIRHNRNRLPVFLGNLARRSRAITRIPRPAGLAKHPWLIPVVTLGPLLEHYSSFQCCPEQSGHSGIHYAYLHAQLPSSIAQHISPLRHGLDTLRSTVLNIW